ncbi:expressed unknown protein [Seminavis robusta]|uniref:Uncharacterized protein n=1 Tax=Seminavis robusta TaxID=568900 RepID=A0A9N8DVQ7_9STRA|nr:expressed unknown protein [Seminavis robusta]|eukprot:Sro328_g118680.1 n/a (198) ;mRNA; f:46983-47674
MNSFSKWKQMLFGLGTSPKLADGWHKNVIESIDFAPTDLEPNVFFHKKHNLTISSYSDDQVWHGADGTLIPDNLAKLRRAKAYPTDPLVAPATAIVTDEAPTHNIADPASTNHLSWPLALLSTEKGVFIVGKLLGVGAIVRTASFKADHDLLGDLGGFPDCENGPLLNYLDERDKTMIIAVIHGSHHVSQSANAVEQ